jgi:hypothetical protein
LSNDGIRPAANIAQLREDPGDGWFLLPALNEPDMVMSSTAASQALQEFVKTDSQLWELSLVPVGEELSWYISGTLPQWGGLPLVVVVVLEEDNLPQVVEIGRAVMEAAGTR